MLPNVGWGSLIFYTSECLFFFFCLNKFPRMRWNLLNAASGDHASMLHIQHSKKWNFCLYLYWVPYDMPQETYFNTEVFYLASGSLDCGPPCSLISGAFMVPSAQWSLVVEQCFMKYCFCCFKAKFLIYI